jgi:small subunit ribosomal protein S6
VTDYEILLMLDPELPDDRQEEIIGRTRESIERAGGGWTAHEPWGRRKLAYEIAHKSEGTYHLIRFTAEPAALDEVSRVLKITDGVMRHMATREPVGSGTRPAGPVETEVEPRQDSEEQPSPVA